MRQALLRAYLPVAARRIARMRLSRGVGTSRAHPPRGTARHHRGPLPGPLPHRQVNITEKGKAMTDGNNPIEAAARDALAAERATPMPAPAPETESGPRRPPDGRTRPGTAVAVLTDEELAEILQPHEIGRAHV